MTVPMLFLCARHIRCRARFCINPVVGTCVWPAERGRWGWSWVGCFGDGGGASAAAVADVVVVALQGTCARAKIIERTCACG